MVEQDIQITKNGEFNNLNLKPKLIKGIKGLEDGNHIVVEKIYKDAIEKTGTYGKFYGCKVLYKGEQVSFILNPKEYAEFAAQGDIGDKVKITLKKEVKLNPKSGIEMIVSKLHFLKV